MPAAAVIGSLSKYQEAISVGARHGSSWTLTACRVVTEVPMRANVTELSADLASVLPVRSPVLPFKRGAPSRALSCTR